MADIRDIWLHAQNMIRSARLIINNDLHPLDLSSSEGNVLLHLFTLGKAISQEQLVQQIDVSKPAISRTIKSLEGKGYITRQRDPDDRRAFRVQLTEKALDIAPAIERVYNRVYTLAMKNISQDELDYFVSLFKRMSENFTSD